MRSHYEFERRFLVVDRQALAGLSGDLIVQAYLYSREGYVVRVRRSHRPTTVDGDNREEGPAMLAVKGPRVAGARQEYELQIPVRFASELIKRSTAKISKTRLQIVSYGQLWDIDVFHGDNEGLVIAECEGKGLASLRVPPWCGAEVTDDRRYDNENLGSKPYTLWDR